MDKSPLQIAKEALDSVIAERKRNQELLRSIGPAVVDALRPALENLAANSKITKDELLKAVSGLSVNIPTVNLPKPQINVNVPDVNVPEIRLPVINVPEPKVTVNVPPIKIPEIKMPEEMDIKGWVKLQGVDLGNPLPVQLRDKDGKPVNLLENLTTVIGAGSGGGPKIMKISDINNSAWANLLNPDGRLRVETNDTGTATQIVDQLSGAIWSVFSPTTMIVDQVSGGNWSVNVGANTLIVDQLSGANWSVNIGTSGTLTVDQLSGANWSVSQTQSWLVDQLSGANFSVNLATQPNTLIVDQVSGANWSVAQTATWITDQVSGGNWSVNVTGSSGTTAVVGDVISGVADTADAPVKIGGIARQANPTAVSAGNRVSATFDDVGRPVTRPVQVRDLIQTAYVAKTTGSTFGTETTLLAGAAGVFNDLIYVIGTNDSDAALTCDFRSATAAGIVFSLRIPANGTAGVSLSVPIPQDVAADTWTLDLPDVTGTNVNIAALFSKEV